MTRLLVSIRSQEEALLAAENGVDIIDIKEPRNGALGRAAADVIGDIVLALQQRTQKLSAAGQMLPVSLALGELVDAAAEKPDQWLSKAHWDLIRYAKVGCCDCDLKRWPRLWDAWRSAIPSHVDTVAVGYADHRLAGSPQPEDVLQMATHGAASAFLLDTFAKKTSHLFDFFSATRLASLVASAKRNALTIAIAGSLRIRDLPRALAAKPDIIGVRGAACAADREGDLSGFKVGELVAATHKLMPTQVARV